MILEDLLHGLLELIYAYFMGVNMKKKIMCKCENLIVEELDEGVYNIK